MRPSTSERMNVLFVCVENSCRSQMAEAYLRMSSTPGVQAFSAGSRPSGVVNPKAIAAMEDLGYDMSGHRSKAVEDVEDNAPFDAVVSMGCGDACPWVPAVRRLDWDLPDPKHMDPAEFAAVRDEIGRRVADLLAGGEGADPGSSPPEPGSEARP